MNDRRIITVRFKAPQENQMLTWTYAFDDVKKEATEKYYQDLQNTYNTINKNDFMNITDDMNAMVGNQSWLCWDVLGNTDLMTVLKS